MLNLTWFSLNRKFPFNCRLVVHLTKPSSWPLGTWEEKNKVKFGRLSQFLKVKREGKGREGKGREAGKKQLSKSFSF
jgi:hypothetical protein